MSEAVNHLTQALQKGMRIRPKVGGFPYLAETLRAAGVTKNTWHLPSCQSLYLTHLGAVVNQGAPLVSGAVEVAPFDKEALVRALRVDQAGQSTFPEFLISAWKAGVIGYEADFESRKVTYFGSAGETYVEEYPSVELPSS